MYRQCIKNLSNNNNTMDVTKNNRARFLKEKQTSLQQLCNLNVDTVTLPYRMTNIICTVGPMSDSVEVLTQLINSGMNICRWNMAHGTHEYHMKALNNLKKASLIVNPNLPCRVTMAVDIRGPGPRIGTFEKGTKLPIKLSTGDKLEFCCDESLKSSCCKERVYVNKTFIDHANIGDEIFIEDGPLSFIVENKLASTLNLKVNNCGEMSSHNPCHIPKWLPGETASLSEADRADIQFCVENEMDMVFVSWTWCPEIIEEVRKELGSAADRIKVIAKIENYQGIKRFDDILKVSDGIMVARGHLGLDIPQEKVFIAQKMMVGRANMAGKPVICAAQMLDSMMVNARPTRAEMSDIANAILDGVDCVMLSKETAIGKHPIAAVQTLSRVCQEAENAIFYTLMFKELVLTTPQPTDIMHSVAIAAVEAAVRAQAAAIIVVTTTGKSATVVARYRPPCVIIAVTKLETTARYLQLHRGCFPVLHTDERIKDWHQEIDHRIHKALDAAREREYVKTNDMAILVTGFQSGPGTTNSVRTIVIPESSQHHPYLGMHHAYDHLNWTEID